MGVHTQSRFPPRCHSNRSDSSEDTLENSSPRSSPEMDSLIKGKCFFIDKIKRAYLRVSSYRSVDGTLYYLTFSKCHEI